MDQQQVTVGVNDLRHVLARLQASGGVSGHDIAFYRLRDAERAVGPPQPAWWPPQPGDVVRVWNSTYLRYTCDDDVDRWTNTSASTIGDDEVLNVWAKRDQLDYTQDEPRLLVRGGKPYQEPKPERYPVGVPLTRKGYQPAPHAHVSPAVEVTLVQDP
jgi:hypothetical protein